MGGVKIKGYERKKKERRGGGREEVAERVKSGRGAAGMNEKANRENRIRN